MIRHVSSVLQLWRKPGDIGKVYGAAGDNTSLWHTNREPKVIKTGIPFVIDGNVHLVFLRKMSDRKGRRMDTYTTQPPVNNLYPVKVL